MKIRSMVALAFALTWSACSSAGSGNDAAMIAAANTYSAAHPICIGILYTDHFDGNAISLGSPNIGFYVYGLHASSGTQVTPIWESPFVHAGLLRRKSVVGTQYEPGAYRLELTPRLPSRYNNLCFGHAAADSVAKTEPIGASYVAYGYSKDSLSVEFRSHFAYADWASDPRVQSAVWNYMLDAKTKDAIGPAFRAILVNDPARGWRAYGSDGSE